ncbi:amidohydrolase family protein [Mycobacteroides abscessus]|uniref:amidohydrolase family protein n=1 Tax=Mycobacteroides abscessus TaxID=36809 RepID=UPI000929A8C4|nr:amidohydrolase family protein [Mycobacteroides abscessus]RIR83240.1 amidohydrolase [Mycobacteroides abscessus]RIS00216.1 amidohydrolase [Mycobacteroides abscessus]SHS58082.1 amidohydrolase [Mycobacteroides abscessus subsp. abscessus]SID65429.1 amidohydrolase [Mycobacteroides abscessus subsp. abscessus]SKR04683.1 amidohydrolase [Mycobacteroides abscessus subsp. abscessus]
MSSQPPSTSRVDLHHHAFPPQLFNSDVAGALAGASGWKFAAESPAWSPSASIAFMDALGISTAILSLPNDIEPHLPPATRQRFAREINTYCSQVAEEHPGRFGFFAHLPTPTDPNAALEEVAHALDVLGADGVTVTNVYGTGENARSLGNAVFEPLWAELDRRKAVVFLHGEQTPGRNAAPNEFLSVPVVEVPNETYKAAADLVTSGRKRQFPNVRIILSHSGGSTPFLASRVAGLCAFHTGCDLTADEIIADFRTFYYETALSGFETNLVALENFVPANQILFGTDFPAVSPSAAAWYTCNVDTYFGDRPDTLADVMEGNARRLLPRFASQ